MAPGFFQKAGDFFKKVWDTGKKAVKKVAEVGKKVWDVAKHIAAPALQMLGSKFGVPTELSGAALGIGEGLLGHLAGEKPSYEMEEEVAEEIEEEPPAATARGPAYYLRRR
jgi:hypothetical protein